MEQTSPALLKVKEDLIGSVPADSYGYGVSEMFGLIGHSGDGGAVMYYDLDHAITITGTNGNNALSMSDFVVSNMDNIFQCAANNPSEPTTTTTTQPTTTTTTRPETQSTTTRVGRVISGVARFVPCHALWILAAASVLA